VIISVYLTTAILLLLLYYWIFKKILHFPAYYIACLFKFTRKFTIEESKSAIGFILVVISHIIFSFILADLFKIHFIDTGIGKFQLKELFLGVLLGIGMTGTTAIFSLFIIKLVISTFQIAEKNIFIFLSSGWFKSYESLKIIMPIWISLPLIIMQLSCEEVIFRSIFLNYFLVFGAVFSVIMSSVLFAIMQVFQMPHFRGAFFPIMGALVMGPTHSYLFLITKSIWPFIVSHVVFFMLFTF